MASQVTLPTECITSFDQVKMIPNSLYVLDIDETTIKYKWKYDDHIPHINIKWWENVNDNLLSIYHDQTHVDIIAEYLWERHISTTDPIHTDKTGFDFLLQFIENNNCQLIFLTARSDKFG